MAPSPLSVRGLLAALVVLSAATLVIGYVEAERTADQITGDPAVEEAFRSDDRSAVVDPRPNGTVVATDSNAFVADEADAPRAQAELVAFGADGRIDYYENRHTRYWDVDPVSGTRDTVEFVYADHLTPEECGGESVCTRNGVERVNLSTGDRTEVFSRITPGKHSTRWHDVDRIDDDRLLVADIDRDRAFVVNVTSGMTEWSWNAQSEFDTASSGGPYPEDWTHINDVEHVEIDGREAAMLSLRNHDQVVFVDYERGLMDEWTLGSDGDHDTLYEQHNPDYIPEERGGPAVLVADSENSRIVEYQRVDGSWERSWTWSDERLQWARDADRLPNGHTLITDSNGDRVLEVDTEGEVVWSASIGFPYESERLGTGDESAGGHSAESLGLESRTASESGSAGLWATLPPSIANAISYLLPRWIGAVEGIALAVFVLTAPALLVVEYRRSGIDIGVRSPFTLRRK